MKVKCHECSGILEIEGKQRDISYPQGTGFLVPGYPHASTLDCPLFQGLPESQLKAHPMMEVIKE